MATTGFWPVKSRLKEVIDYAENPDKTIDKKYVDSDLFAALQYAADDKKTDERMYVSGINCNAKRAYERMTATKKRFGKTGGKAKSVDLRLLLKTLRDMTEINELTPTLVNSLIERIEVHNNDKSSGHCYVKVDIYFAAVGMIDIPTENEILATMEEIRENPKNFRFVA